MRTLAEKEIELLVSEAFLQIFGSSASSAPGLKGIQELRNSFLDEENLRFVLANLRLYTHSGPYVNLDTFFINPFEVKKFNESRKRYDRGFIMPRGILFNRQLMSFREPILSRRMAYSTEHFLDQFKRLPFAVGICNESASAGHQHSLVLIAEYPNANLENLRMHRNVIIIPGISQEKLDTLRAYESVYAVAEVVRSDTSAVVDTGMDLTQ